MNTPSAPPPFKTSYSPSKRIAFVGDLAFDPLCGGVERITDTIARALLAKGVEVFYYCLKPAEQGDQLAVQPHAAPNPDPGAAETIYDYQSFLRYQNIDTIVLQKSHEDPLVSLFLNTGNALVRKIACHHDCTFQEATHLWYYRVTAFPITSTSRLRKWISRILFFPRYKAKTMRRWKAHYSLIASKGAELVMLSRSYIRELNSSGTLFPNPPHAIPNINTYNEPVHVNRESKKKEILYVGRMSDIEKQVSLLLRIWKRDEPQAPDWTLTLIGSGPDEEQLKDLAESLNLSRVRFVARCDPTPSYRRASILCMTSLFEGFPMVLTEAQQQGTAVIAFDSFAAVRDTIEDGVNGVLVTPFRKREYTEKLLHLMQDDEYRLRLARRARETVQQFNADVILPQWLRYLGIAEDGITEKEPH